MFDGLGALHGELVPSIGRAEFLQRSRSDDPPVSDEGDISDHLGDRADLMRRQNDPVVARVVLEHCADEGPPNGVEPGEGLVEEDAVGLIDEGAGELNALLVPLGELAHSVVGVTVDFEGLSPSASRIITCAGEPCEEVQMLGDGHRRVDATLLGQVGDSGAPWDQQAPVRWAQKAGERRQKRGFASAVAPEECERTAARDAQIDVVEDDDVAVAGLDSFECDDLVHAETS